MAKQGSIKHYRQTGTTKFPVTLPYSEFAVAKDGSVVVGDETEKAVELAKQTDLNTHKNDTVKHITAKERTAWNNKANSKHKTQHGIGGADALIASDIGISLDIATTLGLPSTASVDDGLSKINVTYLSTNAPSSMKAGDIWYKIL